MTMPTGDSPPDDALVHVSGANANDQRSMVLAIVDDQGAMVEVERRKQNLEAPWNKVKLVGQLAKGDKVQGELALEYGVSRSAIAMFKQRHAADIEARLANMAAEFDGLWIANKQARLSALQAAAEGLAAKPDARSAEVLAKLLKDAAEELGDLPTRAGVQIQTNNVEYKVIGIGLDALQ